jgi:hypothetical protein
LAAMYRCVLQDVEEAWFFSVYDVLTKCSLSERSNGGQSIALPSRGDVRKLMRQVCRMFDGETAIRTRACTLDDLFNLNCW